MPVRDGHGFAAFQDLVMRSVPGTAPLEARIRQAIVAAGFGPFMQVWDRLEGPARGGFASGGAVVETSFGTHGDRRGFRPSWRTFMRELRIGMFALLGALHATLMPARERVAARFTLLLGMAPGDIVRDGQDRSFVEFCREGPIGRFHGPTRLMVQHVRDGRSDQDGGIFYGRWPLYRLVRLAPAGVIARVGLVMQVVLATLAAIIAVARYPMRVLVLRDLIEMPLARALRRWDSLERVVLTNSLVGRQPLWLRERGIESSLVWYSENNKWLWNDGAVQHEHPAFQHMAVQEHWVWSRDQEAWLRQVGEKGMIHVVGPILWYRPAPVVRRPREQPRWVTVFDVTPVSSERAAAIGYIDNYYSVERWAAFMRGAVAAAEAAAARTGVDIRVRVKPKRHQPHADPMYRAVMAELVDAGRLTLLDPVQDLFEIIGESTIVVVQPFSSPAVIAAGLGVSACYYDAAQLLDRPDGLDPRVGFVRTCDELDAIITETLLRLAQPASARLP